MTYDPQTYMIVGDCGTLMLVSVWNRVDTLARFLSIESHRAIVYTHGYFLRPDDWHIAHIYVDGAVWPRRIWEPYSNLLPTAPDVWTPE